MFSGLMEYNGEPEWPFDGFVGQYDTETWQYARTQVGDQGQRRGDRAVGRAVPGPQSRTQQRRRQAAAPGGPAVRRARAVAAQAARRSATTTLQNPRCVFQIVKRHFSRYTPEMVEQVTGCPRTRSLKVAETILANSGARPHDLVRLRGRVDPAHQRPPDDRLLRAAAAAAGQHRPARRRDHGAPRPRLDPGLDRRADAVSLDPRLHAGAVRAEEARHARAITCAAETLPRATGPTRRSSWSRTSSRCTATRPPPENDFGYDWHPKISATTRTCRCSWPWTRAR